MGNVKKNKRLKIIKILSLIAYIGCVGVLIFESSMNGSSSANQSNAVGGTIADIFNNLGGDKTEAIKPTSLTINDKITNANVGDNYKINTTILPSNSTYQSIVYTSNNENIARVSPDGHVSFLHEGEVEIKAINASFNDIFDSMSVVVNNVSATSISSSIQISTVEDDIYTIFMGSEYSISTSFTPFNATDKSLSYTTSSNEYLTVNEDGIITPLKHSHDEVTTIDVTHLNLTSTLKVKVSMKEIIPVTSIDASDFQMTVGETRNVPGLSVLPLDATFKDINLTSGDSSIAIIDNNRVMANKVGTTTITITSNYYPNVSKTINLTVNQKPQVLDFSPGVSNSSLTVGTSKKISLTNVSPTNADTSNATYMSRNESIATVSTNGTVTGVNEGTTMIDVTINSLTRSFSLTVNPKRADSIVTSFDLSYSNDNLTLRTGVNYNLTELFTPINFEPSLPSSTAMSYALTNGSELGSITDGILTLAKPGNFTLEATHVNSGLSRTIDLVSYVPFSLTLDDNPVTSGQEYSLLVNNFMTMEIVSDVDGDEVQYFDFTRDRSDYVTIDSCSTGYKIRGMSSGKVTLIITPVVNEVKIDSKAISFSLDVSHIFSTSLELLVTDLNTSNPIVVENGHLDIYKNDKLCLKYALDPTATISQVTYSSSNERVLRVDNIGNIIPRGIGTSTIVATDYYSNETCELEITVFNRIKFDNNIELTGSKITYDQNDDIYKLTNGYSVNLNVGFTKDTTYRQLQYKSSDEKVLQVGTDGTITPLKVGKVTITVTCDDGQSEPLSFTINVEVTKQPMIDDLSSFFGYVRKVLGHFGAFLIMGIFSTLTFILFFKKKWWSLSMPLNIAQGFGIACLTEWIQTFVPGRVGSFNDVIIDFVGFLISAVIISLVFLLITLIKHLKKKD